MLTRNLDSDQGVERIVEVVWQSLVAQVRRSVSSRCRSGQNRAGDDDNVSSKVDDSLSCESALAWCKFGSCCAPGVFLVELLQRKTNLTQSTGTTP